VHTLLYQSGLCQKWVDQGKLWMIFIQDTNSLAMKCLPSVLGVSKQNNWEMNSVSVPRRPGEAMGALTKLVDERDPTQNLVINVEYN
jgi:UDP-sugar pyrophosphorylase